MNPRGFYIALAASLVALVIALWAVWEARTAVDRADAMAARLDPIEAARTDGTGRIDALQEQLNALQNQTDELAQRIGEVEQSAVPSPGEPAPEEPAPVE